MLKVVCLVVLSLAVLAQAKPVEEEFANGNPMLGNFLEGDITQININQTEALAKGVAQIPTGSYGLWPNGVIPYYISPYAFSDNDKQVIQQGMNMIMSTTCIRFVPATQQHPVYLNIIAGNGCYSMVGMQRNYGGQDLSLGRGCVYPVTVAHEFNHAIGFFHEQSRPDRDNYLTIYWQNISPNMRYNFDKMTTTVDTMGFGYDYYSIMQYESTAFTMNGQPTMVPNQAGVQLLPAHQKQPRLTQTDIAEIRKLYRCA